MSLDPPRHFEDVGVVEVLPIRVAAVLPRGRALISYYANSVAHLLGPFEAGVRARDALPVDATLATPDGRAVRLSDELEGADVAVMASNLPMYGREAIAAVEAVEAVCKVLGRKRLLVPFPMTGWHGLVGLMQVLPNPPLNSDQLHLLAADNTAEQGLPGFADLGIRPCSLLDKLEHCLQ